MKNILLVGNFEVALTHNVIYTHSKKLLAKILSEKLLQKGEEKLRFA